MTAYPPPGATPPPGSVPPRGSSLSPAPGSAPPPSAAPPPGGPPPSGPRYAGTPAPAGPPPGGPGAESLFLAHKPGVIPLRALRLGDIYDGAVKTVRRNPRATIGLSALVAAAFLIPSALITGWLVSRDSGSGGSDIAALFGTFGQAIAVQAATVILTGLLVYVVSEAVLGRRADLGQTWRRTRGRLLPLIGLNLLIALVAGVVLAALFVGPIVLIAHDNLGSGIGLLLVAVGLTLVGLLWLQTRTCLAGPALVLERTGIGRSLRRGWRLSSGADFWRILGINLLTMLVVGIASSILAAPFTMIGPVVLMATGLDPDTLMVVQLFLSHLAQLITAAIMTPFAAAVTCLLYVDQRIRREALDVTLVRAAQARTRA